MFNSSDIDGNNGLDLFEIREGMAKLGLEMTDAQCKIACVHFCVRSCVQVRVFVCLRVSVTTATRVWMCFRWAKLGLRNDKCSLQECVRS